MDFYIKKHTEAPRFKPHYNSSMCKYYGNKEDYYGDLKKYKLEPYRGEIKRDPPKPYVPSKEAHEFVESVRRRTEKRGNVELSGNQRKYLSERMSMRPISKNLNPKKGGFSDAL
jgi:hypothetical protein